MAHAVELEQVTKSFGAFVAVDDLSLQIPTNTIYGFIGPNGSGKTTTLRMIMRIYLPDRGRVRVLGDESWHAASDRVGYLPEERGLYKQMRVSDVLRFYAELKGFRDSKQAIAEWLERMNLTPWADKKVETLSKGMSQKVQFIATVIAKPELVLLDEPFSGLDPVNAEVFRDVILDLKRSGATVIFSTHDMAVAEKMCDFIFMIYKGKKVLDGTLDSIQDRYGADTVRVRLDGAASLAELPGVNRVTDFGNFQELRLEKHADTQAVLAELMRRGPVTLFEQTRPSLHDIFVRIARPTELAGNGERRRASVHKIRVIAQREYAAAVRTKMFLVSILLMPVLIGFSVGLQILFAKLDAEKEKRYAVIDRTPGQQLGPYFQAIAIEMQKAREKQPELRGLSSAKSSFELVPPSEPTPEAMVQQRFELAKEIEAGKYEALIEIGPKVFDIRPGEIFPNPDKVPDDAAVRFQARGAGAQIFRRFLDPFLNEAVQLKRFAKHHGLTPDDIRKIQQRVVVKNTGLTRRDAKTGAVVDASDDTRIINMLLPGALVAIMFMVIMMGATPAMHGILEEKTLRIAEVLLGSVTPFQLMAGKLLGAIGVAMTMALVYLGGGYFLAWYFGFAEILPVSLLVQFVAMLTLALLIFGSLFIAIGAASADIKNTQTLLMPVMLLACLPFMAMGSIMQDTNGPIARVCSFFPFATPMLLVARESVPPGVPAWEMAAGVVVVLATTLGCLWAASRIFRVGILMQGKGTQFSDLFRWVLRG